MNKNKGIIGIGLIIAIVLGIVVVGGGAYYLGTKKNTQVIENPNVANKLEENNSHEVPAGPYGDETNYVAPPALCNSESKPSIKVLSPNGGESYTAGQKIIVKWKSCNFRSNAKGVNIRVVWKGNLEALTLAEVNGTPNDGEELITLPSQEKIKDFYTTTFVVDVQMNIPGQNLTVDGDDSDNSFIINSTATKTISTKYTLIAKNENPYSFITPPGSSGYYLVKKNINSNNMMYFYGIYLKDTGVYVDQNKIYYNPYEYSEVVRFGSKVSGNTDALRTSVNQEINKNGYAIVKYFADGGPDYINYTLIN